MRKASVAVLVVAAIILSSVATWYSFPRQEGGQAGSELAQFGTLDDLMNGDFDGKWSVSEVLSSGDFGLGTFHALDGEMVVYEGVCYQVTSDGVVHMSMGSETTPFAEVARFDPGAIVALSGTLNLTSMEEELRASLPDPSLFYAIEVRATFSEMVVRSVPRQSDPYPTLADAIKNQTVFSYEDISGALIGIWSPSFVGDVDPPGFHFHFLSDDRTKGGHVLQTFLASGTARIDSLEGIHLAIDFSGLS